MPLTDPRLPSWTPPPGFAEVESGLDGVSVFAPVTAEDLTYTGRTFTCTSCGSSTRFDPESGSLACEHCGVQELVDGGRPAEHREFTLDALREDDKGWGVERREVHCETCGADLAVEPGDIAATCAFCASSRVNVREGGERRLRPGAVAAFARTREDASALAAAWLGRGWMHPGGLARATRVEGFVGVYLPWWAFSAHLDCKWKAEVGKATTSTSYVNGQRRTHTHIHWQWKEGRRQLQVDDHLVPGTERVSRRILKRMGGYDFAGVVDYSPDVLAGWRALAYDTGLVPAWEEGKADLRELGHQACLGAIASPHVRNFSMSARMGDESWRYVLLPAWVAAYVYRGGVYQVVVNGQTGVVEGRKPVAWWKIWGLIALMFSPGLLTVLISIPLLFFAGAGAVVLLFGLVFLILAFGGSRMLYAKAAESEAK